jgi:hypothetical protein
MNTRFALALSTATVLATAPLGAQDLDVALGAQALGVLENGRLLVQNGPNTFDCALVAQDHAIALGECALRSDETVDASALLAELSDEELQLLIRDTLLDANCRLSAFGAVAEIIAAAAEAKGAAPETIERARTELSERTEEIVWKMLNDGQLSVREGELALYACP